MLLSEMQRNGGKRAAPPGKTHRSARLTSFASALLAAISPLRHITSSLCAQSHEPGPARAVESRLAAPRPELAGVQLYLSVPISIDAATRFRPQQTLCER